MAAKFPQKSLKGLKKGDQFTLTSFTGMNLGQYTVVAASKNAFKSDRPSDGFVMEFDRATGVQTNAKNPRFANVAVDLMDAPERKAPVRKAKSKAEKKVVKEVIEDDFDSIDEDEDWDELDD